MSCVEEDIVEIIVLKEITEEILVRLPACQSQNWVGWGRRHFSKETFNCEWSLLAFHGEWYLCKFAWMSLAFWSFELSIFVTWRTCFVVCSSVDIAFEKVWNFGRKMSKILPHTMWYWLAADRPSVLPRRNKIDQSLWESDWMVSCDSFLKPCNWWVQISSSPLYG